MLTWYGAGERSAEKAFFFLVQIVALGKQIEARAPVTPLSRSKRKKFSLDI